MSHQLPEAVVRDLKLAGLYSSSWSALAPGVWRVGAGERRVVVKRARSRRAFEQESRALEKVPQVDGAVRTPRLLASFPASFTLVLDWLGDLRPVPPDGGTSAYVALGEWLRRLHQVSVETDDLPLVEALQQRWKAACRVLGALGADPSCPEPDWDVVTCTRTLCHRDFWARNWFVQKSEVAVVDFEHARADHPATDFVRWFWTSRPDVRSALLKGYGGLPFARPELSAMGNLYAIQTRAWALRNGNGEFLEHANRVVKGIAEQ